MKLTFEQRQYITVLKNKGLKEGIDFRIVWFGNQAEIKIMTKRIPSTQEREDTLMA